MKYNVCLLFGVILSYYVKTVYELFSFFRFSFFFSLCGSALMVVNSV